MTDTALREAFERLHAVNFDLTWSDRLDGYVFNNTQYPYQMFRDGYVACAAHFAQKDNIHIDRFRAELDDKNQIIAALMKAQQPVAAVDKSLGDDTALTQVIKSAIENLGAPCGMGLCDDSQAQYVTRKVIEHFSQPDTSRDDRQRTVSDWCRNAFGDDQASGLPQRGIRLLEEAIEAAQAAGCERDMSHKLVDYIFDHPAGELKQELGGIGVTVLALAAAANLSADDCETREIERVLSKPLTYFTQRNQAKNNAGFEASQKKST